MNLISYKDSWNLIQSFFKSYYNDNNLEVDLFNVKSILFTKRFTSKEIMYIDTFKKEGQYFYPNLWKNPKRKLILVLNNTVDELPFSSLEGSSVPPRWYLVFKHSAAELNNITCTEGSARYNITTASSIFTYYEKVYVPVGLRNDYITFFSNMTGWDPTYADRIVEGDEHDIE